MFRRRLPKSARKFLRREKARIRTEFSGTEEAENKIRELVVGITEKYDKKKVEAANL